MYIEKIEDELYHLKREKETFGDFRFVSVDGGAKRLEKLHVSEKVSPGQVLEIFELIQAYVRQHDIPALQVESHSDSLDILLQHQQFHLKDVEKRLWIYQVNHR
ncbi:hypothetical protein EQV77_08430 [Halobacillus fulvus]|nr:hypothetical protein EQV77_08430 [Halobacillus fulvus]